MQLELLPGLGGSPGCCVEDGSAWGGGQVSSNEEDEKAVEVMVPGRKMVAEEIIRRG